jgi:transcriptional regulator with XRE-family HTH domain
VTASQLLRRARLRAGLGVRALARRAGTSHATLLAYESGRKVPRVDTLERILAAAGFAAEVELAARPDHDERARAAKGRELADVLDLASHFPARHEPTLAFPPFGRAG